MMRSVYCILRSPPFPGAGAATTAISTPSVACFDSILAACSREQLAPAELERAAALGSAVVARRVGGSFWEPALTQGVAAPTILRPANLAQARLIIGDLADPARCAAVLPAAAWASRAAQLFERSGIRVYRGPTDPWSLLKGAEKVYAAGDDEFTFLALLSGISVHVLSEGCFSGWGLTRDAPGIPIKGQMDLARLIHAVLVKSAAYRNCFTGGPTGAEEAIERLAFWRGIIDENRGIAAACGIAWWKRREMRSFLWAGRAHPLRFHRHARPAVRAAAVSRGAIAVWPSRAPPRLDRAARDARVALRQVEDGFVRSVGLGSALHPPLSIVVDAQGIYYDPNQPSDLEILLAETSFSAELLARAERLIAEIVAFGISKYGNGRGRFTSLPAEGRRVLVTGQVEDDRSVQLGGGEVTGNLDLLRRARAAEPDAFILFKPHPDVEAGHRKGRISDGDALRFADRVVHEVAMPALLDAVDALHVWTSLAGFEALLRRREVITHGQPFFAGWGLTQDIGPPIARRQRKLTLPELVAGALILYPRYLDPATFLPCPPEVLIERLAQFSGKERTLLTELRRIQGLARVRLARWVA
jgi:capsular polysaccharide export protein